MDVVHEGASDEQLARYAEATDRLVLTYDDDLLQEVSTDDEAGVLLLVDGTMTADEVGEAVDRISRHVEQTDVTVQYVSRNWL